MISLKHCLPALLLSLALGNPLSAAKETYVIDASHSTVGFKISHFVSKTSGNFSDFEGVIHFDKEDMSQCLIEATIKIESVDTNSKKRDKHLLEDDYFHTAKFPEMTFKSTQWTDKGEGLYTVLGELSFLGKSKEVELQVELLGMGEGFRGAWLSGWHASTQINRADWGMTSGQPAVGMEVDIAIDIEAVRQ